ncbi:MAG: hypothetical protein HC875_30700 [Anaerolineales bacterium]|nr:hypothetical protein [Anaerolineales bacterium]
MKTPFRMQVSEYDCVPTTFINAISALFDREKIPADVVKHIYLYSLNTVDSLGKIGHGGTTWEAIQLVGTWLNDRSSKKFPIQTEYIWGKNVHLGRGNKIVRCLSRGGVVLCNINTKDSWHYILALRADRHSLYFFDPYPPPKNQEGIEILEDGYFSPNLRISRTWLNGYHDHPYRFGIEKIVLVC